MSTTLLCFGGPADGKLLTVARPWEGVLVPVFDASRAWTLSEADPLDGAITSYRYRGERFYMHIDDRHWGPPDLHTEECTDIAWCLVGYDYPSEQIAGAVRLLHALARVPWIGSLLGGKAPPGAAACGPVRSTMATNEQPNTPDDLPDPDEPGIDETERQRRQEAVDARQANR